MKKDQKFLKEIELKLGNVNKKDKEIIISKYRKIIDKEKENKKRIVDILKSIGTPEEIANSEIENLKNKNVINKIKIKFNGLFHKKKKFDVKKKEKDKDNKKTKRKKNRSKRRKPIRKFKYYYKKFIDSFKNIFKRKKKATLSDNIKETIEEFKEEFNEVVETVSEKKIFESKSKRITRIILKSFGIVLVLILLFIWLWVSVVFISSLFLILDGIKFFGINIALLGIALLTLWLLIILNKAVFNKHISFKWSLSTLILFIFIIGFGVAYSIKQVSSIKTIKDVSEKYSMSRSYETYNLPSDENVKMKILFNSKYDTKYTFDYDEKLDGKIKVEVKYYECYYDYYAKRNSNSIYISLKLDLRDRLSVYINDLKDGKVFDEDELSRYTIRIIGSKKDLERVVVTY